MVRTQSAGFSREWAESFTRVFLDWGRRRGWRVIYDVPMEHRNVDHAAITPAAVLANEIKLVGAGRDWSTNRFRDRDIDIADVELRPGQSDRTPPCPQD